MATGKAASPATAEIDMRLALRKRKRLHETAIHGLLFLCGALSILTTLGIAYGLARESWSFFARELWENANSCLLYTSPSPRDRTRSRMPSSA